MTEHKFEFGDRVIDCDGDQGVVTEVDNDDNALVTYKTEESFWMSFDSINHMPTARERELLEAAEYFKSGADTDNGRACWPESFSEYEKHAAAISRIRAEIGEGK